LPVSAQPYPSKPIRVIVPFPPGDGADLLARLIGQKIAERLGQPVVVENRPGAAGQLGLDLAARATPDGYTITLGQGGNLVIAPHTYKKLAYDPLKDFVPIALLVKNGIVLVVSPDSTFKSVSDLIAYAKANPGKLTFASNGEGGFVHLAFELLRLQAGFSYLHVPYKGGSQALTEVLGGQVEATMVTAAVAMPHHRSGKLRLLGTTNPARISQLPDVAPIAESLPGYEHRGWFGMLAPAAVSRETVAVLNREINFAMAATDTKDKVTAMGFDIATGTPERFAETMRADYAKFGKLTRDIGLQPQ
jgi:tripartite-type tricarboxylate transporter receptor subunit TctC